ncbi:MAG: hypothetical protein ACRDI2_16620 [Chloroflexota bacterium]
MSLDVSVQTAFEAALRSEEPLAQLREVVRRRLEQGHQRQAITQELEEFRRALQRMKRDADEDVVLDVMDFLADWCSPHVRV